MIVTLSEVQGSCQKALMGCRFPAGLEEDAGRAAAWLEARGLGGIAPAVAALDRWDGEASPAGMIQESVENGTRKVDAEGRSAVLIGGLLIDLAAADALAGTGSHHLAVSGLSAPQFLLPQADLQRRHGLNFRICWHDPAGELLGGALVEEGAGVTLFGDWSHDPGQSAFEVTIDCRRSGETAMTANVFAGLPVTARQPDLAGRALRELGSGVSVPDDLWARLWVYAHRALVPASAESRARGAGVVGSDKD